jgi:hypothetical protein
VAPEQPVAGAAPAGGQRTQGPEGRGIGLAEHHTTGIGDDIASVHVGATQLRPFEGEGALPAFGIDVIRPEALVGDRIARGIDRGGAAVRQHVAVLQLAHHPFEKQRRAGVIRFGDPDVAARGHVHALQPLRARLT